MSTKPNTPDDVLEVDEVMEENEVAVAYDITSYPSDLTLSVVNEMWKNGEILIPDYQRNFVWTISQSSLLIESFLLGLPVPQVFFYVDESNKNQVIDGQQRIMSVVYYLDGYFGSESIQGRKQVFRLHGLDDTSPFAKKRFEDLSETHQRKLKSAVLRAINIRQMSPKGVATSVYVLRFGSKYQTRFVKAFAYFGGGLHFHIVLLFSMLRSSFGTSVILR